MGGRARACYLSLYLDNVPCRHCPEESADIGIPHLTQQPHISRHLSVIAGQEDRELEINDDGLTGRHHDAVRPVLMAAALRGVVLKDGALVV